MNELAVSMTKSAPPEQTPSPRALLQLAPYLLRYKPRIVVALLAVTSSLFTAFFEAAWQLGRRGYDLAGTLGNNFNPAMFEIGVPPPWQVRAFGLVFVLGAVAVTGRGPSLVSRLPPRSASPPGRGP